MLKEREVFKPERKCPVRNSLIESFFWTTRLITTQGLDFSQVENSLRHFRSIQPILMMFLLIFYVIAILYKSQLLSLLMTPKLVLPFRTLEELVNQKEIPFYILENTYIHNFVKNAPKGSNFEKFYINMKPPLNFRKTSAYDLVINTNAAVATLEKMIEAETFRRFQETGECLVSIMDERFLEVNLAMGLPKKTPWKKDLDNIIVKLKEAGIIDQWMLELMPISKNCPFKVSKNHSKLRPLVLEEFYGGFLLYAAGIILSTISLQVEILSKKLQQKLEVVHVHPSK